MAKSLPDAVLAVGQVWIDNDRRLPEHERRHLRIVEVFPNGARMEILGTGKMTSALLRRFGRAGGYSLLAEPLSADAVDPVAASSHELTTRV